MLEMEYSDGGDTLTLTNKTRVANKKIFEQLQQSARLQTHLGLSEGHMLHRQPSGAQKRIRQRQEQKWLKAVSASSNNSRDPPVSEKDVYRSLIDSGGYKSILPDEPPFTINPPPVTHIPRDTFVRLPSIGSLNNDEFFAPSSVPATTACTSSVNGSPTTTGGKPTVQVHPMPSSLANGIAVTTVLTSSTISSSSSSTDIVLEKVREKPAVPKKPAKLLSSIATSVEIPSTTPLSLSTSNLTLFTPSAQSSPSTSNSYRLFSSPSFMCLHTALMQPSLTDEEIEQLDAKRKKLIESISRKVSILDEERNTLEEDFNQNESMKNEVFSDLRESGDSAILEKVEKNFAQNSQLCRLETRLRMQLERLQSIFHSNENVDKELIGNRIERLKRQLDDQTVLRKAFDRRDAEVDKYILSRLSHDRGSQWRIYKDTWKRLTTERQEIDERLLLGREQINALQNAQPNI